MNERVRRMIRENERAWKKYLTDETYNYIGAQGEGKDMVKIRKAWIW